MKTIQQNMDEIESLIELVKKHPICYKFIDDEKNYAVQLPPGYRMDGVVVGKVIGKISALQIILIKMEYWYEASLPGYTEN